MNMPRASALASSVDGKIYVFGGSKNYDTSAEVFDPKTQTWTPHFHHVVMVIERKQDSPLYEEYGSFYFLASDEIGSKTDWCIIEKQVYYRSTRGKILWCELDELRDWKEVKGLEELRHSFSSSRHSFHIVKLCNNSAGNIVIFWISESLDLWSAEIYVERREGGETWGKIKWSNVVFKVDPFSNPSYGVKILYCASVFV
ncbi:putative F-box/kelch-repeat protein At3g24610 [Capsella rubella]|uniref:putative F-box/kelch-repeat protein At3g24610 n=1 Tax=Capsella rubella TaxID=81985 RepID=UPI000CD57205|nr:putative F-box/kelch-repeat protein At3g24610 [Capsella rubella]